MHRRHAEIGWEAERGPVVARLGKNNVGIQRDGESLRVSKVEEGGTVLQDGDVVFFLAAMDDLKYNITVLPKLKPEPEPEPERAASASAAAGQQKLEAARTQKGIAMLTAGATVGPSRSSSTGMTVGGKPAPAPGAVPGGAPGAAPGAAPGGGVPEDWSSAFSLVGELIGGGDGTGSRLSAEAIHAALRHVGLTVGELEVERWCTGAWHQLRSGQGAVEGSPRRSRPPGGKSPGGGGRGGDVLLSVSQFVGGVSAGADWMAGWTEAAEAWSAATKVRRPRRAIRASSDLC